MLQPEGESLMPVKQEIPIEQEVNVKTQSGTNFSAVHTGSFDELNNCKLNHPKLKRIVNGKMFLRELLGATGMQISINSLAARVATPFTHRHKQNEEIYLFVKGKGQMQVDDETINVEEGSVVRISTNGFRCLRNMLDEPLHFICVQAKEDSLNQDTFDDGIAGETPPVWPS